MYILFSNKADLLSKFEIRDVPVSVYIVTKVFREVKRDKSNNYNIIKNWMKLSYTKQSMEVTINSDIR